MADFKKAYQKTMSHEGLYSHDILDVGGETFCGISRKYNPNWEGWQIIDQIKENSENFERDLKENVLLQELKEYFYKDKYWDIFWGDEILFQPIADEMFDTGVNMGSRRAIKFLQQGLNCLNRNEMIFSDVVEDGVFGKNTMNALNKLSSNLNDMNLLVKIMNVLQGMHYLEYMKKSPLQEKYCRGWFGRVTISK